MRTRYHGTSHLGKMNCDHLVTAKKQADPKKEIAHLREEISKNQSWITYFSGASARRIFSADAAKIRIDAHRAVIVKLTARLAALEPKQISVNVDTAVKALQEVANMTPEEEARLNQQILDEEAK